MPKSNNKTMLYKIKTRLIFGLTIIKKSMDKGGVQHIWADETRTANAKICLLESVEMPVITEANRNKPFASSRPQRTVNKLNISELAVLSFTKFP